MSRKDRLRKKAKHSRQSDRQSRLPTELPKSIELVESPPGEKMSEVLLDFIEPYSNEWENDIENLPKMLALAVLAWNAAISPYEEREKLIEACLAKLPAQIHTDVGELLDHLIRRKIQHFGGNQRLIIDYTVTMTPEGPHVQVVSTLSEVGLGRSFIGTAGRAMLAFGRWISQRVRRIRGG